MKKPLVLVAAMLFWATGTVAQNPNLGSSGAKFLQIPVGARPAAMGGAYVGFSDDATSVFWNPAGLVHVNADAVHFSYLRWFDAFDVNAVSIVHNAGDIGSVAASVVVVSMDKVEITTETSPNGTGRYYDAQDLALGISYARWLTDRFSFGITAKYAYERIWNESADAIAFDIGTQYRIDFQNLTIAMCMTNFGGDPRFDGPDLNITHTQNRDFPITRLAPARLEADPYSLPLHFQVGVGIDILQVEFMKVRAALDAAHPNDNRERINAGMEATFFDRLFLRGGYKYNYDDEKYAFGIGANVPFAGSLATFDYAYSVYDILPNTHRVSVGLEF